MHGLRKLGIEVRGVFHDIVVIAHLLDENAEHGVKELATQYVDANASKWDKRIAYWRQEEAKRRRHEYQVKAKARAADMQLDPVYVQRAAKLANCAMTGMDPKLIKKMCLEMAKEELKDQLCARNKKDEITYDFIPFEEMVPYACADVHYTLLIYKKLIIELAKSNDLKKLYIVEMQLTRVLLDAEHAGVKIDVDYLREILPEYEEELDLLKNEIYEAIGYEFNIGSNDQLIAALTSVGVHLTKLSKGTKEALRAGRTDVVPKFSVDKEVMEFLAAKYPVAEKIQKYRNLEKLKNTYVISIQELVDEFNFLHTDTNQNVSTGRMSMREPNLQNIPARNKAIRKAFRVPDDSGEYLFIFIDYSQVELRLTADRSGDPILLSCYPFPGQGTPQDVHTLTLADVVLGLPLTDVMRMASDATGHVSKLARGQVCKCPKCEYDFFRNIAKRVNFGIIYGAGPEAIQRQVSTPTRFVTKGECEDYIEKYFQKYTGVKEWIRMTQLFMKRHGYVQNSFGRYRKLPIQRGMKNWQIERLCRQGVNFCIQGEAADLFKTAAVRVDKIFKREKAKSRLVNFVHDELQFYWHRKELHLLKEVKQVMEDFQYKVPIVAEISYSTTDWGAKKALKV
jgi:DNA polymerase-1